MTDKKKNNAVKDLENLGKDLVKTIKRGKNPSIQLQVRGLSNVNYDEGKRKLILGDKVANRYFFNVAHAKKFLQTVEVAAVSKNLLREGKHASLRDVFYMVKRTIPQTKINIVDEQTESDDAIEDLEVITKFSREQLHMSANRGGSIVGKVTIVDKGDTIHWDKLGSGGWAIPSVTEEIQFKQVDAKFVLYMEKAAVFERLLEDKFYAKHNCIIVSSQGQTTRGIRTLLKRLVTEHKLPIYVLTDLDPWGFWIYAVLKYGSINLAHMSDKLVIPEVKFLGITVDDIEKYNLQKHLIKFKETDISRLKQISEYSWFKDHKEWQRQFMLLKKMGAKAEIQALSSRGLSFISDKYLPEKIKNKEFID